MANAPETGTVKVVSAWDNDAWYADKIDETFEVVEDMIGYSFRVHGSVKGFHPEDVERVDA